MSSTAHTEAFEKLRTEVLNRVMPGLRHKMLGKLQPVTLLSQVLSRKLSLGSADNAYVQTQVDEIKLNARLLTVAMQNLFTWVALDAPVQLPAEDLLDECVDLLKMECYTNHLIITNHVTSRQPLPALEARVLLCAGIILLADKQALEKTLEIRASDDAIQFKWNKACTTSVSSNPGMLRNWDWITDISPACQIEMIDSGIQFSFPVADLV
ncbi:hypothetical protein ACFQ2T_09320 [Methylophilus flavus]|uniref:Uncharacterized protein n=1 Tax=Methylophilus flavus TaxID=640084 RepID=A0ABW3PKE4_9PROT